MSEARSGPFPSGRRAATRNALAVLGEAGVDPEGLFERHGAGDWGVIEGKSRCPNGMAVDGGYGCVASAYLVLGDVRVVVILTQADRGNTLMALSDEMEKLLGGRFR